MKPLTKEQLINMDAFDWIWIGDVYDPRCGSYIQLNKISNESMSCYGVGWVAYKNKECVCTHPEGCCFPECENQQWCIDNLEDLLKMAGGK